MATGTTTTAEVASAVGVFYDRVLLQNAVPYLHYQRFGDVKTLPSKNSKTIKFRRYGLLTPVSTGMTEGTNPDAEQLSTTDITADVTQYGAVVEITDWVDLTVEDKVITETLELEGEQMGESLDIITRNVLVSTASVTNCSHGSNGNTPTEITQTDINTAVKSLLSGNAKRITAVQKASTGVGTQPVAAAFFGIISTDERDDLMDCSDFLPVRAYPNQDTVIEGEIGSTGDVRWLETTLGYNDGGTPAVYSNIILGKHAYGIIDIKAGASKAIVHGFGSGGVADALDTKATVGWKVAYTAKILNDAFINNLKATV